MRDRVGVKVLGRGALPLAAVLALAAPAMANNVIDGCGQTCEIDCGADPNCREASGGKCVLTDDVTCDSSESAIELLSGNDLEMAGFDITCTEEAPDSCPYAAILVIDSGSKITSDGSEDDGEAVISGRFFFGVDCDLNASSIVENITVFDGISAIRDCRTVRNNVIGPSSQFYLLANFGISTEGIGGSDSFRNNSIEGRVFPISNNGSNSLAIEGNVINTDATNRAITLGNATGGADGVAKFNVFFGTGASASAVLFQIYGEDSVVYSRNYCNGDHPDCAACIAAGRCEPYTSPFPGND